MCIQYIHGFPGSTSGKELTCQCRRCKRQEFNPLEEKMATHSSIPAWRIPWTEPGELQSIGSQRAGHYWSGLTHICYLIEKKKYLTIKIILTPTVSHDTNCRESMEKGFCSLNCIWGRSVSHSVYTSQSRKMVDLKSGDLTQYFPICHWGSTGH